jgi:ethanolamine utilization protein EutP (predicted NTPase)
MMKMGSVDLIVCQERNRDIPYCQVGMDEQMNLDQPEELTEQMRLYDSLINSEMEMDQQVHLTEVKDQDDLLMIGGIGIFLPSSQEEAEKCVANDAAIEIEEQSLVTI